MEDPDNAGMGSTKHSKIVAVLWGALAVVAVLRVVLVRDTLSQIGAILLLILAIYSIAKYFYDRSNRPAQ